MDQPRPIPAPPSRRARRVDADDWVPPKWAHPRATVSDLEDEERREGRGRPRPARPSPGLVTRSGLFVGFAIAPGVVGALAWLVSLSPRLYGMGDLPRGLLALLIVQAAVVGVLLQGEDHPLLPSWIAMLFTTTVMLPVLALQVSLLHEPFVSFAGGSAGPSLIATSLVLALLVGYAVWCVHTHGEQVEAAALAFIPPALAVPSMIGHAGAVTQLDGLRTLLEIGLVATICTLVVWSFPGWPQAMVAALALALELIVLLATGRGPWREPTAGGVVPAVYITMLVVTTLLVVFVPVVAMALAPRRRVRP